MIPPNIWARVLVLEYNLSANFGAIVLEPLVAYSASSRTRVPKYSVLPKNLVVYNRARDGTVQDFVDPTGKFQNLRRLTGWSTGPVNYFFTEGFCSLFNAFKVKFTKRGGAWVRC